MKILTVSTYVTNNAISLLARCKSGFGYMVYDIAKSIAKTEQMDMLLTNYRYNDFEADGIHYIKSRFYLFFCSLFSCCNITVPIKLALRFKPSLRLFVRIVYFWLLSGYYKNIIKRGNYDIVHIHGCGFYEEYLIEICQRLNQRFVITLHGLDSFSDSVVLEPAGKKYERNLLQRVANGEFPITIISSGIKRIILNEFNLDYCDGLNVICNSFSFSENNHQATLNIRSVYGLAQNACVLLYVGNICCRKNQKQIIDAFPYLTEELRKKTYVLFLGRDIETGYSFKEYVNKNEYKDHFIVCGNVDKELVPFYYQQANGVVLLSISEGFGLSLIEGMHFGLPCLTFDDLDAYEDIYNEKAVIGMHERKDESVAKGLEQLLTSQWDSEVIMSCSVKFEPEAMAEKYIDCFKKIIAQ